MVKTSSRSGSRSAGGSESSPVERARTDPRSEIGHLQELAGLLRFETDRWSRQVILAEAVGALIELEKKLGKKQAAS